MLVVLVLLLWLVAVPLVQLLWGSFQIKEGGFTFETHTGLANYKDILSDPTTYRTLRTTLIFAVGGTVVAMVFGLSTAWIVERTDAPLRRFFRVMVVVPLLMPGLIMTIAWIFLLNPQIGWLNSIFYNVTGHHSPLTIYGLPGMIWVSGLHNSTLVFLLFSAALRSMDPTLEEAAQMSGANTGKTARRITLSLLRPAILSIAILVFIQCVDSFETAALIGIPARVRVFTNQIYLSQRQIPPDDGAANTYSVIIIAISALMILMYSRVSRSNERFQTITGKAFRPRQIPLGRVRWLATGWVCVYFMCVAVLPLFILVWVSFLPYFQVPKVSALENFSLDNYDKMIHYPKFGEAALHSVSLALMAGILVMLLTSVIAWITERTKLPGRKALDFFAFVPIAIPSLVIGVALIATYVRVDIGIYGTLWILLLAYCTMYLPFGMRTSASSIVQISKELEEACEVAGAGWLTKFRRVVLPLMVPGMLSGFLYIFILALREFSASLLLSGPHSMVLSILIFQLQEDGQSTVVAALGVMMVIFTTGIVALSIKLTGRIGVRNV